MSKNRIEPMRRLGRGSIFRDTRATTAFEFALIAPLFLLLLFGIFAFSLILFMRGALDNGTNQAIRQIRLGTPANFASALCSEVGTLLNCNSLRYNVQAGAAFGAAGMTTSITTDSSGNLGGTNVFSYPHTPTGTGTSSAAPNAKPFVIVQVGYKIGLPSGYVAEWAGLPSGILLVSTAAFENESW